MKRAVLWISILGLVSYVGVSVVHRVNLQNQISEARGGETEEMTEESDFPIAYVESESDDTEAAQYYEITADKVSYQMDALLERMEQFFEGETARKLDDSVVYSTYLGKAYEGKEGHNHDQVSIRKDGSDFTFYRAGWSTMYDAYYTWTCPEWAFQPLILDTCLPKQATSEEDLSAAMAECDEFLDEIGYSYTKMSYYILDEELGEQMREEGIILESCPQEEGYLFLYQNTDSFEFYQEDLNGENTMLIVYHPTRGIINVEAPDMLKEYSREAVEIISQEEVEEKLSLIAPVYDLNINEIEVTNYEVVYVAQTSEDLPDSQVKLIPSWKISYVPVGSSVELYPHEHPRKDSDLEGYFLLDAVSGKVNSFFPGI